MTTLDTSQRGRQRVRVGQNIRYFPTPAEEADIGPGPYPGTINLVNRDGTVDISMLLPGGSAVPTGSISSTTPAAITGATPTAITAPTSTAITAATPTAITAADPAGALAAFTDPPSAAEMALLRTLVNQLRDGWIDTKARLAEYRTLAIDLKARQAEDRTLGTDLIARQAERRTLEIDVKARLAEYRTIVTEIKADWSGSGSATKVDVPVGTAPGMCEVVAGL
jgi:hypothetical protein